MEKAKRLTSDEKFDIILSKNRIFRELKRLYAIAGEYPSNTILFDISEIERVTGTSNQPTGVDILTSVIISVYEPNSII